MKRFDCDVYPFILWVCTTDDIKGINKKFEFYNHLNDISDPDKPALVLGENGNYSSTFGMTQLVVEKKNRYKGVLIFLNMESLKRDFKIEKGTVYDTVAHEAKHVADIVSEMKDIAEAPTYDLNEHQAYLIGWIAGKIGEFYELEKSKKKKQ